MHFIGIKEHDVCKISLFSWNNKYIIKFEWNQMEQSFKIDAYEVASEAEVLEKISEEFIQKVLERFQKMAAEWYPLFD
jgi:hydrogenase maturation factor